MPRRNRNAHYIRAFRLFRVTARKHREALANGNGHGTQRRVAHIAETDLFQEPKPKEKNATSQFNS